MDDIAVRLIVVVVAAAVILGLAMGTRRWQRPSHPPVELRGLGLPSGGVVFTSTECERCKDALTLVRAADIPVREVTWELEPRTVERAGVTAVPLTVFVGEDGAVVDQIVGVPSQRRLRSAVGRWRAAST